MNQITAIDMKYLNFKTACKLQPSEFTYCTSELERYVCQDCPVLTYYAAVRPRIHCTVQL